MPKNKLMQTVFAIAVIAAVTYLVISYTAPYEKKLPEKQEQKKLYNYTAGTRPDYGLPEGTFRNLPPLPQDFWEFDQKFVSGQVTDFVDLGEEYWKQPEFYPTFEENIDFIKNPQGSRVYAFGIGAYPGDVGADAFPDSQFTVATFFYSSWLVETYQGMKLEAVYPETASVLTPDLQGTNFTVNQNPSEAGKYFNVTFEPETLVLDPSAPVFGSSWAAKVKINVTVSKDTPKGTYIIGVNPSDPPPEQSGLWLKTYEKYSDGGAFRIGRPVFQLIVFVN